MQEKIDEIVKYTLAVREVLGMLKVTGRTDCARVVYGYDTCDNIVKMVQALPNIISDGASQTNEVTKVD